MFLFDGVTTLNALCLIIGFVLIGIEFVAPGLSAPGITGTVFLVMSIFLIADTIVEGVIITVIVVIILAIMFFGAIKLLSKGAIYKKIVLQDEQSIEEIKEISNALELLIGKEAVTITDLRPSGFIEIDGQKLEVVSNSQFINKSENIKIVGIQGTTLVVSSAK
ncbi:MAG: hypothetical protein ATN35_09540 [Epulopiscium sp. Nele67-Bin004]|nr:MAG: hypothetical protein ATN35_09540 [Epulopiscium sp. Nele67-Bin004]